MLVQLQQGVQHHLLGYLGHLRGTLATQPFEHHHLKSAVFQEQLYVLVGHRPVGREDADPLDITVASQGRLAGIGAHGDAQPSHLGHAGAQLVGLGQAAPEGLGGHSHHQVVWVAGHHPEDGVVPFLPYVDHQLVEIVVAGYRVVGDPDARHVVGDTPGPHLVELGLDRRVGRGRYNSPVRAPSQFVRHLETPSASHDGVVS